MSPKDNIGEYLKYYWLEKYLFGEVNRNFRKNKSLTPGEFLAIVIWKRNASKTKIARGLSGTRIRSIVRSIYDEKDPEKKLEILLKIKYIGIAIASAVLTVLYPNKFTVVDYRVLNSLKRLSVKIKGKPMQDRDDYLAYVDICKKEAKKRRLSLRNLDRALWGMDFYEGKGGLYGLSRKLK